MNSEIDAPSAQRPLVAFIGVFLGALIWLWPYTHGPVSQFWPNFVAWMSGLALWLTLLVAKQDKAHVIVLGWLAAAVGSALLGLLQYFDGEGALYPFVAQALPGSSFANTRQTNHLASLLNVGFLCVIWLMRGGKIQSLQAFLIGLPLTIALASTASRGGAVQLLLVGGVIALYVARGIRSDEFRWWLWMLAAYVVFSFALPLFLEWFSGVEPERQLVSRMAVESTCSSRLVLWRNVLDLIAAKPMFGWGWEGLRLGHYMTEMHGTRFCSMLTNAHNLPLHLATEFGLPVAAMLVLGTVMVVLWARPWAETHPTAQLGWSVLLLVGFHSLLEFPVWFGNFQSMVLLAVWMLWPHTKARRLSMIMGSSASNSKRLPLFVSGTVAALLCAMAVDYVRVTQLYLPQDERLDVYKTNTLEQVRHSVFFRDWVLFAQVVAATPDQENASALLEAAQESLRISPEPRVIERLIVSASILGRQDLVQEHIKRYRDAWPQEYATWMASQQASRAQLGQ